MTSPEILGDKKKHTHTHSCMVSGVFRDSEKKAVAIATVPPGNTGSRSGSRGPAPPGADPPGRLRWPRAGYPWKRLRFVGGGGPVGAAAVFPVWSHVPTSDEAVAAHQLFLAFGSDA